MTSATGFDVTDALAAARGTTTAAALARRVTPDATTPYVASAGATGPVSEVPGCNPDRTAVIAAVEFTGTAATDTAR